MINNFDVIVVGGGHAGCEASVAAATMGSHVLLISMDISKLAQMSCNPAMGGVAKGQIVREIDALGGKSGIITDQSSIQFRMLNMSKGPAMWSPRSQCDRMVYSQKWREVIETTPNLYIFQDNVISLLIDKEKVIGVTTQTGITFKSSTVILTNGTFLGGLMHVGSVNFSGGRAGEPSSHGISQQLFALGFEVGRMKTGTPVRIDERSVNLNKLIEQKGDEEERYFSFESNSPNNLIKKSCYIAHTSEQVHNILRTGFEKSPLFSGTIKGIGPRYCPSIEDKLRTFADKTTHQLFLEPEGERTYEMYLNGFSSSLPAEIQYKALRQIEGFENVHILRPGYAIEYDYFPPTQLKHSLETKLINGLFFAGQINGTTGYEEAAAQGLMAGVNAHRYVKQQEPIILSRDQAYIGVLIDDLITKGVDEPYRMFTSRAEYRILLRQDNADERLMPIGYNLRLISENTHQKFVEKQEKISRLLNLLKTTSIHPDDINDFLVSKQSAPISQSKKIVDITLRPEISLKYIIELHREIRLFWEVECAKRKDILECTEIRIKYGGYIDREKQVADKLIRLEHIKIHPNFDYNSLQSLSTEARQKLSRIKPETIGQAARIPGVSPNDINVLLIFIGR
jgi:tRNA uridine 5-carboxymethylaminomethyl modification enzyme